jgi:peptide/nickel transport system permease protein
MKRYIIGRLGQGVAVLALVAVVVFIISRLSGSPVNQMLPEDATEAQKEQLTQQLGLDQPLPAQFGLFVVKILGGDFGESHRFHIPALELVLSRLGNTVALAAVALVIAVVVGVALGMRAALSRGKIVDHVITGLLTIGQSVPSFWIGILLILVVGVSLKWLPFAGNNSPQSIVLPAITLSIVPLISIARVTRSSMIETMNKNFITTAKAKGLRAHQIVRKHMLRNSSIPVLTMTGLMFAEAIGGAVITERIFAWPGIGSLAVEAIATRDYAVIQTITLIVAFFVVTISLLVDLAYLLVDPRIRVLKEAH